jgi:hypothetical protein
MYPYFQIAESGEELAAQSVFSDCFMLVNLEHPDTGKRYLLAKKFPTLDACTRAYRELVPDAEFIVETYLPRKSSKHPEKRWYQIPKNNAA